MPRAKLFDNLPPFPEDVLVADLPRISLSKLLEHDAHESEELFRACKEVGFFLLDLTESNVGETVLDDAEKAFDLEERIFALSQEELEKFILESSDRFLYGYKRLGAMKVDNGSPDGVEIYAVGQDDMLGTTFTERPNVKIVLETRKLFKDIFHHIHGIISHTMSHLDAHLGLAPGTFAALCSQDKPSATLLRMLKSPPHKGGESRTNLTGHTDIGAMTMLFNILGGLQILPPGRENIEENWVYVRPEPGCAVVNIGDAMVQWSGGVLRSNIHRVNTAPGQQASCPRYSLAYLLRPGFDSSMRRLACGDGVIPEVADVDLEQDCCAREWEEKRRALVVAGNAMPKRLGGGY